MESKVQSMSYDHTSSSSLSSEQVTKTSTGKIKDPTSEPIVPSSTIELPSRKERQHESFQVGNESAISKNTVNEESTLQQELSRSSSPASTRNKKVQILSPSLPTIPSASTMSEYGNDHANIGQNGHQEKANGILTKKESKRKHRRNVPPSQALRQMASIEPNKHNVMLNPHALSSSSKSLLPLPIDQYECTLHRRAIHKREASQSFTSIPQPKNMKVDVPRLSILPSKDDNKVKSLEKYGIKVSARHAVVESSDEENLEIEGDTSLGMKLTILSGKVIVQRLMPLQDGRASPAQLTGMIFRGDVLLSIEDKPLVSLGNLDVLIQRLKPLSTPDESGEYKRNVRVRFAVGEGLALLQKDDGKKKIIKKQESNTFRGGQYILVDNLSGATLFQNHDSTQSGDEEGFIEIGSHTIFTKEGKCNLASRSNIDTSGNRAADK
eukprot:scaffold10290_cov174-Chaetoceros_neogracile.AAC.2